MVWPWSSKPTDGTPKPSSSEFLPDPPPRAQSSSGGAEPHVPSPRPSPSPEDPSFDPYASVPPELRILLEGQVPKSSPSSPSSSVATSSSAASQKPYDPTVHSKYGQKYAEYWALYKPPEQVDAEYRTPSTATTEVFQGVKSLTKAANRAALENCAFEQERMHECFAAPLKGRWGGCGHETAELERCYKSQQGFLKALGYVAVLGRGREDEEARIQMKADALWREQLEKERVMKERMERGEKPV